MFFMTIVTVKPITVPAHIKAFKSFTILTFSSHVPLKKSTIEIMVSIARTSRIMVKKPGIYELY